MKKKILSAFFLVFMVASCVYAQQAAVLEQSLALKYFVQMPTEKTAKPPVVILLHGYGSNERDLFDLRAFFPKSYLVVSARAPYTVTGGGYQWFEKELVNNKYTGKKEHLDFSRAAITKFISQVVRKYSADSTKVYLVGFSQGAMMCYEAGLTAPQLLKGIGILSGRLPESLKPLIKRTPELKKLKIFVAHGTADTRLSFADGKEAADYLRGTVGLKPEFHKYDGMEHSITNAVMLDLAAWAEKP